MYLEKITRKGITITHEEGSFFIDINKVLKRVYWSFRPAEDSSSVGKFAQLLPYPAKDTDILKHVKKVTGISIAQHRKEIYNTLKELA